MIVQAFAEDELLQGSFHKKGRVREARRGSVS